MAIYKNIQFKIQKRVGFSMAFGTAIISIGNLFINILAYKINILKAVFMPEFFFVIIFVFPAYLTTTKDSAIYRACQVVIFIGLCFFASVINSADNLTDVYFLVCAVILGIQYNFLKKRFLLKIFILVLCFTILKLISGYLKDPTNYLRGLTSIVAGLFFLYIIWVAFAEEIKEYDKQNRELQHQIDQNEIFVTFGKNLTHVIHNLKNKMMAIQNSNELISIYNDPEIKNLGKLQNRIINEAYQIIYNLTFAVKSKQDINQKIIPLNKIISSVIDLYKANPKFLKEVNVELDLVNNDYVFISPSEASQLLDNLLINSWQAKKKEDSVTINIKTEKINDQIKLIFKDNGIGITFCENCPKKRCINCKQFQIGKTTKEDGSGIGMIYIMNLLKFLNGDIKITGKKNEGTTIEITFHAELKQGEFIIE